MLVSTRFNQWKDYIQANHVHTNLFNFVYSLQHKYGGYFFFNNVENMDVYNNKLRYKPYLEA